MPEGPEVRIMSEYINDNVKEKKFSKLFHVEKGNNAKDSNLIENFYVESSSSGKELKLSVYHDVTDLTFSIFMGMSGNWKFVPTSNWQDTKYVRMRLDTIDGYSLLLYGSYMGPKYRLGEFTDVKRGPDPTKDFEKFKSNIYQNLNKKVFDKPICEAILDQKYFNGIGNYLRSTILYYLDIDPFQTARDVIENYPQILEMCKECYFLFTTCSLSRVYFDFKYKHINFIPHKNKSIELENNMIIKTDQFLNSIKRENKIEKLLNDKSR